MLAACLRLWDLMWCDESTDVYPEEEPILVKTECVHRAFVLLKIFDAIARIMGETSDGSGGETISRSEQPVAAADKNLAPPAQHSGFLDTLFARRLLQKAVVCADDPTTYEVKTLVVWSLFTKREIEAGHAKKPTVHDFRSLVKRCPETLGRFDAEKDALYFKIDETETCTEALQSFANVTASRLRGALDAKAAEKRGESGGRRGRAGPK